MSPLTPLLPPPISNKTFTSMTTQTESTEPIPIATSGASLVITDSESDHPTSILTDNLEYNIENQKKSPTSVDVIYQNEHYIEPAPSSESPNLHPNTTKIPPKSKPPDPPKYTDPYASYTQDGYKYYYATYKGTRYLTRRILPK
jgi:hypothetical protein